MFMCWCGAAAQDGADLVIDRDYIKEGLRQRAEARLTLELGPRSEREINRALQHEVAADRWTSLDHRLQRLADDGGGIANLQPGSAMDNSHRTLLLGRAAQLERLGLADTVAPACWSLRPGMEATLRDLAVRSDIIKTMHRAFEGSDCADPSRFAIQPDHPTDPVIGRLVARGLHDRTNRGGIRGRRWH